MEVRRKTKRLMAEFIVKGNGSQDYSKTERARTKMRLLIMQLNQRTTQRQIIRASK